MQWSLSYTTFRELKQIIPESYLIFVLVIWDSDDD